MPDMESRRPLTITLDPELHAFMQTCVGSDDEARDQFFDMAVRVFRRHLWELSEFVEREEARGLSVEKVIEQVSWEVVFHSLDGRKTPDRAAVCAAPPKN